MFVTAEYRRLLNAERMLDADINNPETAAKDRAACARVLVNVLDMKRILRMRPKPKDIDVSKRQARPRHDATPSSPSFVTPPKAADAA